MNLLSIDTKNHQVTAYACTGKNRVKLLAPVFDRALDPEEVEEMRRNPEKFVYGVTEHAAPEVA